MRNTRSRTNASSSSSAPALPAAVGSASSSSGAGAGAGAVVVAPPIPPPLPGPQPVVAPVAQQPAPPVAAPAVQPAHMPAVAEEDAVVDPPVEPGPVVAPPARVWPNAASAALLDLPVVPPGLLARTLLPLFEVTPDGAALLLNHDLFFLESAGVALGAMSLGALCRLSVRPLWLRLLNGDGVFDGDTIDNLAAGPEPLQRLRNYAARRLLDEGARLQLLAHEHAGGAPGVLFSSMPMPPPVAPLPCLPEAAAPVFEEVVDLVMEAPPPCLPQAAAPEVPAQAGPAAPAVPQASPPPVCTMCPCVCMLFVNRTTSNKYNIEIPQLLFVLGRCPPCCSRVAVLSMGCGDIY